ncbi:unnamed protein product, partial [Iphiclides podalirius]
NVAVAKLTTGGGLGDRGGVRIPRGREPLLNQMTTAVEGLRVGDVVLGGDMNAWNTWWGSRESNRRGIELAAALDVMELHILNRGSSQLSIPTEEVFATQVALTSLPAQLVCWGRWQAG